VALSRAEPADAAGPPAITPLDLASLEAAVVELAARDADLAGIVERYGPPPLWDREPGFPTLCLIILALTLTQLKLAPRWVHYEAEKK